MSRHSASGPAWEAQRQRVLDRDGWRCAYCGCDLVGSDATVDHLESVASSGRDGDDYLDAELVAACRRCNGTKQDKPLVRLGYRSPRWFG